jgi:hypothetical protein
MAEEDDSSKNGAEEATGAKDAGDTLKDGAANDRCAWCCKGIPYK